ncbi:MAG TPA: PLP-dependent aminotransferase family protein [Bryobacteraceae bacterium]|jgi:DNA-binding transcriptional MocR family regulator|nr:PLP-dependent aminotransferase family protein [Bryobacteraceae bacterium]
MKPAARGTGPLYIQIAENLTRQIAVGALRPGDRAPSLRQLSREQRISISTALQAYLWLEDRGYLEPRPKSGFYVRTPFSALIPEPEAEFRTQRPATVDSAHVLTAMTEAARDPAHVSFGPSSASPELFPNRRLNLILQRIVRSQPLHSTRYDFPPGVESLRRQIARRSTSMGCAFGPRDITITTGALDAINLCLRAVARPGDVIAVESPTYFGILGSAASLGMKVVEIPTHPQEGIDLNELQRAIRKHRVKACIVMPNCHNPLGFVMRDERKKELVELTARAGVALIEDDIYADLAFTPPRPRTAKSWDKSGSVMLCSSFSKILSPGYRIGWIAGGRFQSEIERLQLLTTMAAPSLQQHVISEFLESGGYDRHVKRLRTTLALQVDNVRQVAAKYLPEGTRISRPAGGYVLWVQLPGRIDALKLHRAALAEHISIVPGIISSATGRYKNYIRISCGHTWSDAHDRALLTLGRLCDHALRSRPSQSR